MAPLCSVCDEEVIHLAKEHELAVGENLTGKIDFVLCNRSNNVQKDHEDAHAAYDVFV